MYTLTVDNVSYKTKPSSDEMGQITNRMKSAVPFTMDEAAFCEHVRQGKTFMPGVFAHGIEADSFVSIQVIAIDFDNKCLDGVGCLDPLEALERCEENNIWPLCLYFTMSSTEEHPRFRIVFDLDKPITDREEAEDFIRSVLFIFPECDQSCTDITRRFYGSNGEVWECWQVK